MSVEITNLLDNAHCRRNFISVMNESVGEFPVKISSHESVSKAFCMNQNAFAYSKTCTDMA